MGFFNPIVIFDLVDLTTIFSLFLIVFVPRDVLNEANPQLTSLGEKVVSPQILEWVAEAERNLPYIERQDLWGHTKNKLITSEGWKNLKEFGVREGSLSVFYDGKYKEFSRIIGFTVNYIFSPSSGYVVCPFAMTDGCARVCQLLGPFEASGDEYYNHLVSSDPSYSWTSGQWMTERPGGSDVSRTETIATPDPTRGSKQYKLSGFKWFSSATDSEVSIALARVGDDKKLSCFILPVKKNVENGKIIINRLKKKFGTVALPTAELELRGAEAELVGIRGKGVATIAIVLNITRIYSSTGSVSFLRRAINIAREYSLVRQVFGHYLCDMDSHMKTLAEIETLAHGMLFLSMYGCELIGVQEMGAENEHQKTLGRIIPGIAKAFVCKKTVPAISECLEALGGVGYLEFDVEFNIARLLRDSQVNSVWEGTTNVLSDDFIRFLMNNTKAVVDALGWLTEDKLQDESLPEHNQPTASPLSSHQTSGKVSLNKKQIIKALKQKNSEDREKWAAFASNAGNIDVSSGALTQHAREYIFSLAEILISTLLIADASRTTSDRIKDEIALEVATRWTLRDLSRSLFARLDNKTSSASGPYYSNLYLNDDKRMNKLIVYGTDDPRGMSGAVKL